MRTCVMVLATLLCCRVGSAADTWIIGQVSGFHPMFYSNVLYIGKIGLQGTSILVDSIVINDQGTFEHSTFPLSETGFLSLKTKYGSTYVLVASPTEKLNITCTASDLEKGNFNVTGSAEHEIYKKLEAIRLKNEAELSLRDSLAKQIHPFDAKYTAKSTALRESYFNTIMTTNIEIDKLTSANPRSMVANVFAGLYYQPLKVENKKTDTAYDNNLAYWHYHFFDRINFGDPRILTSPFLYQRIEQYFKLYVDPSTFEGLREGADILFSKINNQTVSEPIALHLISYFNKKNDFEMTDYLFNRFYQKGGCEMEAESDVADLVNRMRTVAVGSIAPYIALPDETGNLKRLRDVKNKKVVLLMFWASWCPHCTDNMPEIQKMYEEYAPRGLEIYAISLDHTREEWKRYLNNMRMSWINVAEGKGPKTEVTKTYGIRATPSFILLDSEYRIKSRSGDLSDVVKKLNEALN